MSAMGIQGGVIGDLIAVIIGVANDDAIRLSHLLDIAVAVADLKGGSAAIGLHHPVE